jgi:hypothetical protein
VPRSSRLRGHEAEGRRAGDGVVPLADPDARANRNGKLGKSKRVGGRDADLRSDRAQERGVGGLIVPPSARLANLAEDTLLPATVSELTRLCIRLREIALEDALNTGPTRQALDEDD